MLILVLKVVQELAELIKDLTDTDLVKCAISIRENRGKDGVDLVNLSKASALRVYYGPSRTILPKITTDRESVLFRGSTRILLLHLLNALWPLLPSLVRYLCGAKFYIDEAGVWRTG